MNTPRIFDRAHVARARARGARSFAAHDFLHRRAMADVVDRLETVTRSFERALLCGAGGLEPMLTQKCGVGEIVHADLTSSRLVGGACVVFDEERSPLAAGAFDLIVSLLTLHSANDLVGALVQHRMALKPDGLFIAALLGGETLSSLRRSLIIAEVEARGGASPRVAPFADLKDLGQALQRAGFALPVADVDAARVAYADPKRLIADLRGMGETGALAARGRPLSPKIAADAFTAFAAAGGEERFDIVYLTGWAPHQSQQKPLAPGAGRTSLEKAVGKFS